MKKIFQVMPCVDKEELNSVKDCFYDKWLTEGPKSKEFLEYLKQFTGSKYAVFAPNGTLGLFLSLLALDLPRGSEIIIPSFTFFASASAAIFAGLKPVFVDVNENTFNIDVNKIEALITENTKAIMPVHIYGHAAKMDIIMEIAKKYNLKVIEDAAQAYGVKYKGKHCGTFGDVSMISFFADKTITTGEGAVVLTQNEEIYNKLLLLRNQGRPNSGTFIHPSLGMNFRITDIQAAVGLVQAKKFKKILEIKLKNYNLFYESLKDIGDLQFLKVEENSNFVPFRFYIKTKYKSELIQYLEKNHVQSRSFFYPLHKQPSLKEYSKYKCPISERLYEKGICLPIYCDLTEDEVLYIIKIIKKFFNNFEKRNENG